MGPFIITVVIKKNNKDFESFQKHYVTYILNANQSDLTLLHAGYSFNDFLLSADFPHFFPPNFLSGITLVYQTATLHTRTDILFC